MMGRILKSLNTSSSFHSKQINKIHCSFSLMIVSSLAASTAKPLKRTEIRTREKISQKKTGKSFRSLPDSLAQLLHCHLIFIVEPPEKHILENLATCDSSTGGQDFLVKKYYLGLVSPEACLIQMKLCIRLFIAVKCVKGNNHSPL